MATVRRARKKAPIRTSAEETYMARVGSSLKRDRVSPLAPLSHAQSFDNPQASSTKIRSGFVTRPVGGIEGGAKKKKAFPELYKDVANNPRHWVRRSGESVRSNNAALVKHLGLQGTVRGLWPKKDSALLHEQAQARLREQRKKEALAQPWGPKYDPTKTDAEEKAEQAKMAVARGEHGFGKKKSKKSSRKKR